MSNSQAGNSCVSGYSGIQSSSIPENPDSADSPGEGPYQMFCSDTLDEFRLRFLLAGGNMSKSLLKNRAIRISSACAACRSRHLKCNGATPVCLRCQEEGTECVWIKSKRGGRSRNKPSQSLAVSCSPARRVRVETPSRTASIANTTATTSRTSGTSPVSEAHLVSNNHLKSSLLDLYYSFFHDAQPCALPRPHLERKIKEQHPGTSSLLFVIQFIGSLFTAGVQSEPLEEQVKLSLLDSSASSSGFEIQALVLYATVVYWRQGQAAGRLTLDKAIKKGLYELEMHKKEFAINHSDGDPILAECWRRTWWQLYITDCHMAAIARDRSFQTSQKNIQITAELPCEEFEYESNCIPQPRTLEEYDNREFDLEGSPRYSSFAYLVGLIRALDAYVCGERKEDDVWSRARCARTDAAVLAWETLLPKDKRSLILPDGRVDELLWKAKILVQAYVAELHRPFSTLSYSRVEVVSTCAPPPPPARIDIIEFWDAPSHTVKIVWAMEKLIDLLVLFPRTTAHSPFSICIIAATTITHLSACKYLLQGKEREAGRERIRAAIGALETFAEVWHKGKRIAWEVKTIARDVLGLGQSRTAVLESSDEQNQILFGDTEAVDWSEFATQMVSFDASGFSGFDEYFESSLGGINPTFSNGGLSDVAIS